MIIKRWKPYRCHRLLAYLEIILGGESIGHLVDHICTHIHQLGDLAQVGSSLEADEGIDLLLDFIESIAWFSGVLEEGIGIVAAELGLDQWFYLFEGLDITIKFLGNEAAGPF